MYRGLDSIWNRYELIGRRLESRGKIERRSFTYLRNARNTTRARARIDPPPKLPPRANRRSSASKRIEYVRTGGRIGNHFSRNRTGGNDLATRDDIHGTVCSLNRRRMNNEVVTDLDVSVCTSGVCPEFPGRFEPLTAPRVFDRDRWIPIGKVDVTRETRPLP